MRYYYQYRADMLDRKGWRHKKSHGTKWCRIPIHGSVRKIEYSYQLEFATFLQGKWCISCGFQQESLYYQPKQLTTKGNPLNIPLALHCWFLQKNDGRNHKLPVQQFQGDVTGVFCEILPKAEGSPLRLWHLVFFAKPEPDPHISWNIQERLPNSFGWSIFKVTGPRSKNSVYHPPSNSHKWRSIGIFYQKKEKWKKGDCYWVLRGSSSQ